MSEENSTTNGIAQAATRGGQVHDVEDKLQQATGRHEFQTGPAIDVSSTPATMPGELSESKDGFEVGGENNCKCNGETPELAVDKGQVGMWRFQIVYCTRCMHRFGAAVEPANEGEESVEDGGGDE